MRDDYVHGYSEREAVRLVDQAKTLAPLMHHDTRYSKGSKVLEAGCGVGAQTITLAKNSPQAEITSIDISTSSLNHAKALIQSEGITNVQFQTADIMELPFDDETFDHVFICFVLEHLPDPVGALLSLQRVLKKGGSITVIEGDHGSCYFHPETEEAVKAWQCLIKVQKDLNCNPLMGRELYPLLNEAGFEDIQIDPRVVYVDESKGELVDGFIKKTIIAMVEGVKDQSIDSGLITPETWDKGIQDLHLSAEPSGTFFYNFFKGTAKK
ncbi:methyltransferase domain-containing protein [uncultured Methanobacterium sp.]|uniref:methyltransferase domain-containing protein n=1 Tax=uncultured Methanobacterium sp. TaxID=176306 RepID=UPI002AA602BD|nr:methyltransferase domain-containing protein [uncultured Methanobacterium sp.]